MTQINKIPLPNFICIGAQRAGTTWLYHCLKEHPQIFVPKQKELRFFNYNYDDGIEAYSKNFENISDEIAYGELTPDYYRQQDALLRIKEHLPDVKLVFILRNPIHRAFSQYQLYCGTEYKETTFEETYLAHPELIEWGKYGDHLEFIYKHFNKGNVLTVDYDLLKESPEEFLRQIFEFLGVDSKFIPSNLKRTYNKVIYPSAQKIMKSLGLRWLIELVKISPLGDLIRNRQKKKNIQVSKQEFEYLVDKFKDDVRKLELILDADFSDWLSK